MTGITHGGNVWQGNDPSEWLDFSANIRPDGPPDWVKQSVAEAMRYVSYYPQPDMQRARRGLAEYLWLPEEWIQPASGGASAIELATRCGMERVLLCSPCFGEYKAAARKHGLPVESVCLLKTDRTMTAPAEAVRGILKNHTLIWVANPANPTGHLTGWEEIEALLELARSKQSRVAVDEAFIDFCPGASCRDLIETYPELIVVGSLTKIFGIPGIRLGYLCAQDALKLGEYSLPWELNCFAEHVAANASGHREELLHDAGENALRREQFTEGLRALALYVYPSQSNFMLVDLCRDAEPVIDALKDRKILVRRCMDFEGIDDGRHVRLAVKDEVSNRKFLVALQEILSCAENH